MQTNQQAIARRFDAASNHYDQVASVQQRAATQLLQLVQTHWAEFVPQTVLELGAGSGYLSEQLQAHFPESEFILNDNSSKMLACAQQRFQSTQRVTYHLGDFDALRLPAVDLIISNLALQWSAQLAATLRTSYLNSQRFAFSGLLQGTFSAWDRLFTANNLPSPVYAYWTQEEYEQVLRALEPKEFLFTTQTITLTFEHAHAVMRYFQQLGVSWGNARVSLPQLRQLIQQQQTPIELNYQLFFALVVRSDSCESL